MTFLLLLAAAAAALDNGVIGEELKIKSVDEFIQFKDNVNSGNNYSGTTVFLDSDLSFAGRTFEPIGNRTHYFVGTFDGQGHVISNLEMNSSSDYVGLFGYSYGLTIKNVILDSSCSITSSFSYYDNAHIGGIIGYYYGINGPCTIENSVNMGSVAFSGNAGGSILYLGGIGGYLDSNDYDITVKSCANYGDVTHSGESYNSGIGGIVGRPEGSSSKRAYIYNCLNHGTITHSGTTSSELRLGGIVGFTGYTIIENCVSGGKISLLTIASNKYIGSIVGYALSDIAINYTYFTSDLSGYDKYGNLGSSPIESNTLSYDSTTFELNETVSIEGYTGTSLIEALNAVADYYTLRDYSHWLFNKRNNAVSFIINRRTNSITLYSQVILLPGLASEGNMTFDGWYTDNGLTTPLTEFEVTSETELYGKYCGPNFTVVIVTLDANGGDELAVKEMTIGCDRVYGDLPEPTRTGYTFIGWFTGATKGDNITSKSPVSVAGDHTLYAHWTPNNYTVTFNAAGGSTQQASKKVTYDSTYGDLPIPTRTGYGFSGWFTEEEGRGKRINPNSTVDITEDLVLYADWTADAFTVAFNATGGISSESSRVLTFDGAYGELPTATRAGYTLTGWFTEASGGEKVEADTTIHTAGDHTLYAQWEINKYNVTFDGNGGTPSKPSMEVTYDEVYGDLPTAERVGYSFTGWFTEEVDGTNTTAEDVVKITVNQTLYAHWVANVYTVTFGGNEGTPEQQTKEVTYDEEYGDLPEVTRTGYSFTGWFTEKDGGENVTSEEVVKITEDQTLYAHWNINQYNLTFVFNNGVEDEVRTLDYDEKIVYPEDVEKTGYAFDKWNKETDRMPAENITITAQWTANNYTVTFNPNGGIISQSNKTVTYDSTYGELPIPKMTGYSFIGWFTEENESITEESTVKITGPQTLYAQWTINNYTLTFVFNNGTDLEVRVLEFNEAITYPADPVRAGYSFAGWDNDITTMPANNFTITAQWTANNYTVTFNPSGGSVSQSTKAVTFGSAYGELPNATRKGYTFLGWFTEKNESITAEFIVETPDNHTLYAHWLEATQSQVEIIFSTKDMTKEEIEEVIKKYTDADFKITVIESSSDDEDGMRVIVEFVDIEKAGEFARDVNDAHERGESSLIKRVDFVQKSTGSFSPAHHPMSLFCLI